MKMNTRETRDQKQGWIPKKERVWVIAAIIIAVPLVFWEITGLLQLSSVTLKNKHFEHTFKNFGSNARIGLFFVLAYYVLLRITRIHQLSSFGDLKKWLTKLLRFTRRWHTPVAIIAIAFIILHTVAVFMYGFKLDINNVSGLLALIVLLPVPISGLLRYQRKDRNWHLKSGVAFAILFLIHSFL
jgi:hypothetical protein